MTFLALLEALVLSVYLPDLAELGSECWETREAAQRRLERSIWLAWPAVEGYYAMSADPEVRRRIRHLQRWYLPDHWHHHWSGKKPKPPCEPIWWLRRVPALRYLEPAARQYQPMKPVEEYP